MMEEQWEGSDTGRVVMGKMVPGLGGCRRTWTFTLSEVGALGGCELTQVQGMGKEGAPRPEQSRASDEEGWVGWQKQRWEEVGGFWRDLEATSVCCWIGYGRRKS
jgi:hypothetical protein